MLSSGQLLGIKIDRKRHQEFCKKSTKKSITNRPNIDKKSSTIGAGAVLVAYQDVLVVSWGVLPRFLRVLERPGGVLGGVLAASWGVLAASWDVLWVSLGALGRLLAPLGASQGRLGLDFVAKWSKIEACHLGERFLLLILIDFSSIVAPNFQDEKPTKR